MKTQRQSEGTETGGLKNMKLEIRKVIYINDIETESFPLSYKGEFDVYGVYQRVKDKETGLHLLDHVKDFIDIKSAEQFCIESEG